MKEKVKTIAKRAIISRVEIRYYGVALGYVFLRDLKQKRKTHLHIVLISGCDVLFPLALEAMSGDELLVDCCGKVIDICQQSIWFRIKNCFYLIRNKIMWNTEFEYHEKLLILGVFLLLKAEKQSAAALGVGAGKELQNHWTVRGKNAEFAQIRNILSALNY